MIEAHELYKYYGRHRAIGPLSFTIEPGKIVGLLGLNGAGKTTALRILACDLLPSGGRVTVHGVDVVDNPHQVRKTIGYLPDLPPLYPEMSVNDYLIFAARLRGLSLTQAKDAAVWAERVTQIDGVSASPIFSLSHGYRQRVGIAQAIVHKPRLLLLDEPIQGLDPVQIVEMRHLLRSLAGDFTIVLSSHNLQEISKTCDQILVLGHGEILAQGTEDDLFHHLLSGFSSTCTIVGSADKACDVLKSLPGVTSVSLRSPSEDAGGSLSQAPDPCHTIDVFAESDVRAQIARALVLADVDVIELGASQRELESVFIRLADPNRATGASGFASGPTAASKPSSEPPSEPSQANTTPTNEDHSHA